MSRPDGPVHSIVVAAGDGTRFGGRKQLAEIAGRTIVSLAVEAVAELSDCVIVVVPPDLAERPGLLGELGLDQLPSPVVTVPGRETRAGSVRAGLEELAEDCRYVLVHDAARPLASPELSSAVLAALTGGAKAVVPGVAVCDTVKKVRGDRVISTLERSELVAVQTPQGFDAALLRAAHTGDPEATDDAGLVEALGEEVVVVPGEPSNLKITSTSDLALATYWWERRAGRVGSNS